MLVNLLQDTGHKGICFKISTVPRLRNLALSDSVQQDLNLYMDGGC